MRNLPKLSVTATAALLVVLTAAGGMLSGPAGFGREPQSAEAALLIELKKLLASDAQALDFFGLSVAVSGDTAVVGAPHDDGPGAAYVFQQPAPTPTPTPSTENLRAGAETKGLEDSARCLLL